MAKRIDWTIDRAVGVGIQVTTEKQTYSDVEFFTVCLYVFRYVLIVSIKTWERRREFVAD
jgi:hypothetical protein